MKFLIIALFFVFLVVEGFSRRYAPRLLGYMYEWNADLGMVPKPDGRGKVPAFFGKTFTFSHDKDGFRSSSIDEENARENWLFVGDSMIYGPGVNDEETLPRYLEESLSLKRVRVINAGAPGRGPDYYLRRLRSLKDKRFTRIGVFFTGYNDFKDSFDARSGVLVRPTESPLDRLRFLRVVTNVFEHLRGIWRQTDATLNQLPNPSEEQYRAAVNLMRQIQHEFRPAFYYMPSREDISEKTPSTTYTAFERMMNEIRVSGIDLRQPLIDSPKRTSALFQKQDNHLTAEGNQTIAAYLLQRDTNRR